MANCECHNQMVSIPKMMIEDDDIHQMLNHIHHIHHLVSIHVTCFFLDSIWWFHQAEPKSAHCSLNLEINGFGATHGAPILETPYLELCKLQQEVNHEICALKFQRRTNYLCGTVSESIGGRERGPCDPERTAFELSSTFVWFQPLWTFFHGFSAHGGFIWSCWLSVSGYVWVLQSCRCNYCILPG